MRSRNTKPRKTPMQMGKEALLRRSLAEPASQASINHHFACPVCNRVRRCEEGEALHRQATIDTLASGLVMEKDDRYRIRELIGEISPELVVEVRARGREMLGVDTPKGGGA